MHAFLSRNYRPDLALRHRAMFEWQFLDEKSGQARLICGWTEGRLIAILGYITTQVFWGSCSQPQTAAWAINWMGDPESRGLGWLLMRRLQEQFPIVLGVGVTTDNQKIIERLGGWSLFHEVPRYLCVLDRHQSGAFLAPSVSLAELPPEVPLRTTPEVTFLSEGTTDFAPAWELYPSLAYGTVRSFDYLRWRYLRHPAFAYSIALLGPPYRPAVCVYRVERAFGRCQGNVGRLTEFFYPEDARGERDGVELLAAVIQRLRAAGCAYADYVGGSASYSHTLLRVGWSRQTEGRQLLPVRLCPVEHSPFSHSLEFTVSSELPRPALEQMYVTRGDGDQDRPVTFPSVSG